MIPPAVDLCGASLTGHQSAVSTISGYLGPGFGGGARQQWCYSAFYFYLFIFFT